MGVDIDAIKIEPEWKALLQEEFEKPYFAAIKEQYMQARAAGKQIFPPPNLIFNAFDTTPPSRVKAVILGQDPYHKKGQAMGLCFSVPKEERIPASLRNIYKELNSSLGIAIPTHGDLSSWAQQGVFMPNTILTVEEGRAGSHRGFGWERFSDAVIARLSESKEGIVFMLWGNYARKKKALIDSQRHYILESAHPSPLAGNRFLGNGHFKRTNEILRSIGKAPIEWAL